MKSRKHAAIIFLMMLTTTVFAQQQRTRPSPEQMKQQLIEKTKARLGDNLLTTAEGVIENYLRAIGGREALQNIKTMMYKGTNIGLGEWRNPIIRYYKTPNLLRQQNPGGSSHIYSNGKKVWSVSASEKKEMTQRWTISLIHERIDNDFIDYDKSDVSYKYMGLKAFDNDPFVFYVLERTYSDGFAEDLYFHVDSGLLCIVKEQYRSSFTVLYDYRDIGGILFPHLRARTFDRLTPPHVFMVDEVKVNESYEDSFFSEHR